MGRALSGACSSITAARTVFYVSKRKQSLRAEGLFGLFSIMLSLRVDDLNNIGGS